MSLRHAILGILDFREMHGYKVKCVLESGIATFWPVNLAAIYPNLRKLEDEGLVAWRREAGADGRPDRKVYTITEAGRQELARWRRLPPEGSPAVRNPLFLKLLFAKEENLPDTVEWVRKELEASRAKLDELRAAIADPTAFSSFFIDFMRETGAAHLELQIEMLTELHARIARKLERRSDPPAATALS